MFTCFHNKVVLGSKNFSVTGSSSPILHDEKKLTVHAVHIICLEKTFQFVIASLCPSTLNEFKDMGGLFTVLTSFKLLTFSAPFKIIFNIVSLTKSGHCKLPNVCANFTLDRYVFTVLDLRFFLLKAQTAKSLAFSIAIGNIGLPMNCSYSFSIFQAALCLDHVELVLENITNFLKSLVFVLLLLSVSGNRFPVLRYLDISGSLTSLNLSAIPDKFFTYLFFIFYSVFQGSFNKTL